MTGLKRWHLVTAFVALMILRMVIGYHFFTEGTDKIKNGFDSGPFLSMAQGPLAPLYHGMLDDHDGHYRLCISQQGLEGSSTPKTIDSKITFAIWDDFVEQAAEQLRFGDPLRLEVLRDKAAQADSSDRSRIESQIKRIESQNSDAAKILEAHQQELTTYLEVYEEDIIHFANTADRLNRFQQDGANGKQVVNQVESLRGQVGTVWAERRGDSAKWFSDIGAMWDSLELQVNALANDSQAQSGPVVLHRPYSRSYSMKSIVDQVIPWFDTIIGVLLLLGLFTRFASLSAIIFLASVILSQPFWVAGSQDTWLQIIELFSLLVVFATCAGRYGGLDFFLSRQQQPAVSPVETR